MNFLGPDAFELRIRSLGGSNRRKLGDQFVVTGIIQCLELGGAGMRDVVEVERSGNDTFDLFIYMHDTVSDGVQIQDRRQ